MVRFGSSSLRLIALAAIAATTVCVGRAVAQTTAPAPPARSPDVPFVPTQTELVRSMLDVAQVDSSDVVYDLGCGDGRIVVAAVRYYGAKRGVCVDIDPKRIEEARHNADTSGVADRITFSNADLFQTDLREATVVTLYLSPDLNRRLRPKLLAELRPGSRIVSHAFDMGDWAPARTMQVTSNQGTHTLYLWVVPGR